MASIVWTQKIPLSLRVGGQLNAAKSAGLITDAMVNDNATVSALKTAITTAAIGPKAPYAVKINLALDKGVSMGLISATHGVTTVAGLVALTDASTTFRQGFMG